MIDTTNEATRDIRDIVSTPPNPINRTTNEYVREIRDTLSGGGGDSPEMTTPLSGIYYGTSSYWNSKNNLVGQAGYVYIYSDYQSVTVQGETYNIPAIKVGDGNSYLIDIPFVSGGSSSSSAANVISHTTAEWNSNPLLVSSEGTLYVYTDYKTLDNGVSVPGIKVGDGSAYVVDLPFIGGSSFDFEQHITNMGIHVADDDREFWDNKWSGYIDNDDEENLVFTTELI